MTRAFLFLKEKISKTLKIILKEQTYFIIKAWKNRKPHVFTLVIFKLLAYDQTENQPGLLLLALVKATLTPEIY